MKTATALIILSDEIGGKNSNPKKNLRRLSKRLKKKKCCVSSANDMKEITIPDLNNSLNRNLNKNIEIYQNVPESVEKALQTFISKEYKLRPTDYMLQHKSASLPGENGYGDILRTIIQTNNTERSLVVKVSPKNEARRHLMRVVDYYKREVFMYENVIRNYMEIQNDFQIPLNLCFNAAPKLLYSSLDDRNEFLIFNDLNCENYEKFQRGHYLTYSHTSIVMKELGKFHAMSFILKYKRPKNFQIAINELKKDNLFTDDMKANGALEFSRKYICKVIKMLKEQSLPNRRKLVRATEHIRDNFHKICLKLVDGSTGNDERYAVICHGDFWNNNILYRYDENGEPIAVKILDYQISRYASPVLDIVHYLFTCTEKTLRDQYFWNLMETYHVSLSKHLKLFDLNVEKIYPMEIFQKQLKDYGLYGLCISIYAVPFFISETQEIPDLDEMSDAFKATSSEEDLSSSNSSDTDSVDQRASAFMDEFEMLTERTTPIFKRIMTGIILDLQKYDMLQNFSSGFN